MAWNSSTVSVGDPTEKADYDRLMNNTIFILSGTAIFTGTKTFNSTVFVVAPDWRGVGKQVNAVISGSNTVVARDQKIYEIGSWNMSATAFVSVPHGLTIAKIIDVRCVIISDSLSLVEPIYFFQGAAATVPGGTVRINSGNIVVLRVAGEHFDSDDFNNPAINRGWITVDYMI